MVENHPIKYGFSNGSTTHESLSFIEISILGTSNGPKKRTAFQQPFYYFTNSYFVFSYLIRTSMRLLREFFFLLRSHQQIILFL